MDEKPVSPASSTRETGSALERFESIVAFLKGATPALFLDFDGTLAPIVDHPSKARLESGLREVLGRLARRWPVAIVSGRQVSDVRARTGVDDAVYAGDHGLVCASPKGERFAPPVSQQHLQALRNVGERLKHEVEGIDGAWVEVKQCTLSVHTRQAQHEAKSRVERIVDVLLENERLLKTTLGKEVVEVRPAVVWGKGEAILNLLAHWRGDHGDLVAVVIGDDVSDEAAFEAVKDDGVTVFVGNGTQETAARYRLAGPGQVHLFLRRLEKRLAQAETGAPPTSFL